MKFLVEYVRIISGVFSCLLGALLAVYVDFWGWLFRAWLSDPSSVPSAWPLMLVVATPCFGIGFWLLRINPMCWFGKGRKKELHRKALEAAKVLRQSRRSGA
jgi:hypothetical protein